MPVSRSIATDAIIPLIRARALGLSFTSTNCALPESRTARDVGSSPRFAPSGGSSSTVTTHSPSSSSRCELRRLLGRRRGRVALALAHEQRARRRPVLVERRADRLDLRRRRAAAAADDPRAERARLRRELAEVLGRRVREDDARRRRCSRGRCSAARRAAWPASRIAASASSAAAGPAPWFVPIAATLERRAAAPPAARADDAARASRRRCRTSAAPRSAATTPPAPPRPRDTSSSRSKNVSIMNRSTPRPSSTPACSAYSGPCSRVEHLELAERPDRAGDEHVAAGDLARLAREPHAGAVDRLELVLEEVLRELRPVGAERVRLDQLGAGADVAECTAMTLSGARRFASSGQRRPGAAPASSAPMPPSATIGGPSRAARGTCSSRSSVGSRNSRVRRAEPPPAPLSVLGASGAAPAASGPLIGRTVSIETQAGLHLSLVLG